MTLLRLFHFSGAPGLLLIGLLLAGCKGMPTPDERAARQARSLYGLIYPERHLQERLYSFLPLLAKHGPELTAQVYEALDVGCADHRILVV